MTTEPEDNPAMALWGYGRLGYASAGGPAQWEMGRLAMQAGDFLARHTRRPTPSEFPPSDESRNSSLVLDGWVRAGGWQPITEQSGPERGVLDPEVVNRRFANSRAVPKSIRDLLKAVVRTEHYDLIDLPDGAAISLGAYNLPEAWWGFVRGGWLSTITGNPGTVSVCHLPEIPYTFGTNMYDTRKAMEWLSADPSLDAAVQKVLRAQHLNRDDVADALALLRWNEPHVADLKHRTVLARLVSLYGAALEYGRDKPLVELIAQLSR